MTESFIVLQSLQVWHLGRKAGSSTVTEESRPACPVRCGASDKTSRAEEGRPLGRGRAARAPPGPLVGSGRSDSSFSQVIVGPMRPVGDWKTAPEASAGFDERAGAQLRAGFGETLGAHGSRRTGKAHAPRAPAPRMASLLSGGNVSAACRPLRGCTVTHLLSSQFRRRTRGSGWPHRWWRDQDQDLSLRCQHTVLAPAATREGPDTLIHVYKDM